MRALTRSAVVILASGGVAACSLAGLTFDLAGAGGAPTTASTAASGGAASTTATATATSTSTGPDPSVCGDGALDPGEQCDDMNLVALDGCSPTCTTEVLETCPGAPVHLAPPGLTINGTLIGKTEDLDPSCGNGKADAVYAVIPTKSGTLSATILIGNGGNGGLVSIRSTCADGVASELVCKQGNGATAQIWVDAGVTYWVVVSGDDTFYNLDLKLSACGDGKVEGLEECDDDTDSKCIGCTRCNGNYDFRDPTSKHCYRLGVLQQKSWASARAACVDWGGDLAALGSKTEADYINSNGQFGTNWLGGTDATTECAFSWSNGEPWHAKWDSSQPNSLNGNEDCVAITKNGGMNDYPCASQFGYLCERAPAGSCGDGIISPGEECDDAINSPNFTCAGCKLSCKQGEFEDPATRHCYRVVPNPLNAVSAAAACVTLGATLAAVNTPEENALIHAHVTTPAWLGLGLAGNPNPTWNNGDPICFSNTPGGVPIAGCVNILADGTWAGASCNQSRAYVCEREN